MVLDYSMMWQTFKIVEHFLQKMQHQSGQTVQQRIATYLAGASLADSNAAADEPEQVDDCVTSQI